MTEPAQSRQGRRGIAEAASSDSEGLAPIFCLFSGEHSTLPVAEAEAILESERLPTGVLSRLPRVMRFGSTVRGAEAIARRAAYTRRCCREVFFCEAEENQVLRTAKASEFRRFLGRGEVFRVEVTKIDPKASFRAKNMEGEIGRTILDSVPQARVSLTQSAKTFLGVISEGRFLLGLVVEGSGSRVASRMPHLRPFFHPSAMRPKLARCMVNLSRARPRGVFLDAFCGPGSLLIEAGLMGCTVLGSDIDPRMVRGASRNLLFLGIERYLCVADARRLPFGSSDSCASDPPYGRGSSTHGVDAKEVVEGFLGEAFDVLVSGSHICLAFPQRGNVGEIGERVGYEVQERHLVREHKSLTREVVVFRRP